MSDSKEPTDLRRKPEDFSSEISAVEISIEREKLKLEQERIAIERDRLEAEREKFELSAAAGQDPDDIRLGITTVCIVAAACLLLGGVIGLSSGIDIGRRQSPEPRKILVSRNFIDMMKSINGLKPIEKTEAVSPKWIPPQNPVLRETLIWTR